METFACDSISLAASGCKPNAEAKLLEPEAVRVTIQFCYLERLANPPTNLRLFCLDNRRVLAESFRAASCCSSVARYRRRRDNQMSGRINSSSL